MPKPPLDLSIRQSSLSDLINSPGSYPEIPEELKSYVGKSQIDFVAEPETHFLREDFVKRPMKRARFERCLFESCDFSEAGAASSHWLESEFRGCQFRNANFQYANLTRTRFSPPDHGATEPNVIDEANFSGATLYEAFLDSVSLIGSSAAQADFSYARLSNCQINATSLEAASFVGAEIVNTDLQDNNLEYCDFNKATFKNSRISLMQYPYTFGLLGEGLENRGITITSSESEGTRYVDFTPSEVRRLLGSMETLFRDRKDFFPLANILLSKKEYPEFGVALQNGIKKGIHRCDYRSLRYFSRLAKDSMIYGSNDLEDLFNLIRTSAEFYIVDPADRNTYLQHEGAIRQILLPPSRVGGLTVQMEVIPQPGFPGGVSSFLLSALERFFEKQGLVLEWHALKVGRNSPETARFDIDDLQPTEKFEVIHKHYHHHRHYHDVAEIFRNSKREERRKLALSWINLAIAGVNALATAGLFAVGLASFLDPAKSEEAALEFRDEISPYVQSVGVRAYYHGTLILKQEGDDLFFDPEPFELARRAPGIQEQVTSNPMSEEDSETI